LPLAGAAGERVAGAYMKRRAASTTAALETIANHLAGLQRPVESSA